MLNWWLCIGSIVAPFAELPVFRCWRVVAEVDKEGMKVLIDDGQWLSLLQACPKLLLMRFYQITSFSLHRSRESFLPSLLTCESMCGELFVSPNTTNLFVYNITVYGSVTKPQYWVNEVIDPEMWASNIVIFCLAGSVHKDIVYTDRLYIHDKIQYQGLNSLHGMARSWLRW